MATQQPPASPPPTPPKPAAPAPAPVKATHGATGAPRHEIILYSHSNLFYWWPVWVIACILGCLTAIENKVLGVLPNGSEYRSGVALLDNEGKPTGEKRPGYVFPEKGRLKVEPLEHPPHLGVSERKSFGVLFVIVLLLVIFITNVPLRGMWSVLVIATVIMLSIIFALAGWWEHIMGFFRWLDIRITEGGYFTIAVGLFIVWLVAFMFFDKQVYAIFTPGQFKICTEVGGAEKTYDTMGMTIEKQKSDLFRHLILGLGSGDLIVRTAGADRHEFPLINVLFVSRKLAAIEEMQRVRQQLDVGKPA